MAFPATNLTVVMSPVTGSTYTVTGMSYSFGGSGAGTSVATYSHTSPASVSVTAAAGAGFTFVNWTWTPWAGGPPGSSSTSNPLAWSVTGTGTIQANFSGGAAPAARRRAFIY